MIQTRKFFFRTAATVRLMPSHRNRTFVNHVAHDVGRRGDVEDVIRADLLPARDFFRRRPRGRSRNARRIRRPREADAPS